MFYADYGRIGGRDKIWVQDALKLTVVMFKRVGLETNMQKTNSLVCTLGYIWGEWSKEAYKRQETGEGGNFRKINWLRLSCS